MAGRKRETALKEAGIAEKILSSLENIPFGTVTFVVQNYRLVQIDINHKIRCSDEGEYKKADEAQKAVCRRLEEAFGDLEYGRITVVIQKSRIVQIEKTVQMRTADFMGLDGEGI
jgi:hypothetical protein